MHACVRVCMHMIEEGIGAPLSRTCTSPQWTGSSTGCRRGRGELIEVFILGISPHKNFKFPKQRNLVLNCVVLTWLSKDHLLIRYCGNLLSDLPCCLLALNALQCIQCESALQSTWQKKIMEICIPKKQLPSCSHLPSHHCSRGETLIQTHWFSHYFQRM